MLEQAWKEVQDARQALARAEERLRAEIGPVEDEPRQLAGPSELAPPAVGGPMGKRHGGGGRSAEYQARTKSLEADVLEAQKRFDAALRRYNALR